MSTLNKPLEFQQEIIRQRIVSPEQLQEALKVQTGLRDLGIEKDISEVIVDKGFVSKMVVNKIRSSIGWETVPIVKGYEIQKRLGKGGMGEVFLAVRKGDDLPCALKLLGQEFTETDAYVRRFLKEANFCITLNHTNLVKGYETGFSGEYYYFAMEYVDGISYDKPLKRKKVIKGDEALEILIGVGRALEHAQKIRLVHRDIKPANIMISRKRVIKLCDLGLSKVAGNDLDLTKVGTVVGTPYYIAPEQAAGGRELNILSDMYSLGASVYHLISGRPPHTAKDITTLFLKHQGAKIPPLSKFATDIDPRIEAIIHKLLNKKPEQRYKPDELIKVCLELQESVFANSESALEIEPVEIIQELEALHTTASVEEIEMETEYEEGWKGPASEIVEVEKIKTATGIQSLKKEKNALKEKSSLQKKTSRKEKSSLAEKTSPKAGTVASEPERAPILKEISKKGSTRSVSKKNNSHQEFQSTSSKIPKKQIARALSLLFTLGLGLLFFSLYGKMKKSSPPIPSQNNTDPQTNTNTAELSPEFKLREKEIQSLMKRKEWDGVLMNSKLLKQQIAQSKENKEAPTLNLMQQLEKYDQEAAYQWITAKQFSDSVFLYQGEDFPCWTYSFDTPENLWSWKPSSKKVRVDTGAFLIQDGYASLQLRELTPLVLKFSFKIQDPNYEFRVKIRDWEIRFESGNVKWLKKEKELEHKELKLELETLYSVEVREAAQEFVVLIEKKLFFKKSTDSTDPKKTITWKVDLGKIRLEDVQIQGKFTESFLKEMLKQFE
ncbi:MAG: serine/threonine-protein kinase [Planctomycetota bacterium]